MCVGSIEVLTETWDEESVRMGRLEGGRVVPLAFVPEARAGAFLLLHLGIPVEVLEPATAREALALRAPEETDPGGGPP
jgi:hydrogenase maturation factor